MSIILYDIKARTDESLSPNVLRALLSLKLKGLAHEVKWVELCDIESFSIEYGIAPTSTKEDGSPFYTLPAIHDLSTGTKLADSWAIAIYLDKTYPDSPRLFPEGTIALQRAFTDSYYSTAFTAAPQFYYANIYQTLSEKSHDYFTQNVKRRSGGKTVEDLVPKGEKAVSEWAKYEKDLGKLDTWYGTSEGPFLMGDSPVWSDLVIAATFMAQRKLWGSEHERWKEVASWQNGRWGNLLALLEEQKII